MALFVPLHVCNLSIPLELNRKFIGIEIAPEYFEMAKNRITNTDQKPCEIFEENKIPQQIWDDSVFD